MFSSQIRVFRIALISFMFIKSLEPYRIINCGSNKIAKTTLDIKSGKYIIQYDDQAKVEFGNSHEVIIWCESDVNYDECGLIGQSRYDANGNLVKHRKNGKTTQCNWSLPLKCGDDLLCKDNNLIKYFRSSVEPRRCQFTFSNPSKLGKKFE